MSRKVSCIHVWIGSYKALVHYFGEEEVLFVQSLLLDMENELSWSLGEPYYVNILLTSLL